MIKLLNVYEQGRIRPGAIEFLYNLLEERPAQANISHAEMPTLAQHRAFMVRRPYRLWYLIEAQDIVAQPPEKPEQILWHGWVGAVAATHLNEVGISILAAHRGKGYGSAAVQALIEAHRPLDPDAAHRRGRWVANVAPENAPSLRMFEKLGSRLIQHTYELPPRGDGHESPR